MKSALTSALVLLLPNFENKFVVETDASTTYIIDVLMQDIYPIYYINKVLGPRHQSMSAYEKELMPVIHAVHALDSYLAQKEFTIRTYQKSLKYLLAQKVTTPF